jgi:hypothetical protein
MSKVILTKAVIHASVISILLDVCGEIKMRTSVILTEKSLISLLASIFYWSRTSKQVDCRGLEINNTNILTSEYLRLT